MLRFSILAALIFAPFLTLPVLPASASGCASAASQVASQTGGQVIGVQAANQGGQAVCVVTVLVPGSGGGPPQRRTVTVPAG